MDREVDGAELLDELLYKPHGLQLHVVLTRFHGQVDLQFKTVSLRSFCQSHCPTDANKRTVNGMEILMR